MSEDESHSISSAPLVENPVGHEQAIVERNDSPWTSEEQEQQLAAMQKLLATLENQQNRGELDTFFLTHLNRFDTIAQQEG